MDTLRGSGTLSGTSGTLTRYTRLATRLALSLTVCLGGCAQVTVLTEQAPPQSEWKFGVLALDLAASTDNTIITTSGVGLTSSPSGIALGYSKAKIVRIGDECRVVIAVGDLEAISKDNELLRRLKSTYKACTV